jgi:DNA adenine methylase
MTKPFIKYPGNKHDLFHHISPYLLPAKRLVEPFCGCGGVWLNTKYENYLLSDTNKDLIALLKDVRDHKHFFEDCYDLFLEDNNTEAMYYTIRKLFNMSTDQYDRSLQLVYLLYHCYNGLMRYNRKGEFNTSFGCYKNPYFPKFEILDFYKKASDVEFYNQDFRKTLFDVEKGDMVYCDPPYIPFSDTANFTTYGGKVFGIEDHNDLSIMAAHLCYNQKVPVVISGSDTELTRQIYADAKCFVSFSTTNKISCQARTERKELLMIYTP